MLARFGDEIAEPQEHVVAHAVPVGHAALLDHLADERVEIFAVPLEGQVEGHVVDAGAAVVDLLDRHADVGGDLLGGALHAVAEARPS